jgi:hypothetical protein
MKELVISSYADFGLDRFGKKEAHAIKRQKH